MAAGASSAVLAGVVVYLDAEYNQRAHRGDDIGDYKRPVSHGKALDYKEYRAETEHTEGRHGDAVGIACADSDYRLGQIAKNHADRGRIAYDV